MHIAIVAFCRFVSSDNPEAFVFRRRSLFLGVWRVHVRSISNRLGATSSISLMIALHEYFRTLSFFIMEPNLLEQRTRISFRTTRPTCETTIFFIVSSFKHSLIMDTLLPRAKILAIFLREGVKTTDFGLLYPMVTCMQ